VFIINIIYIFINLNFTYVK